MITNLNVTSMGCIRQARVKLGRMTVLVGTAGSGKTTIANALRLVAAIHQRDGTMPTHDEPARSWDRIEDRGKETAGTTVELLGSFPGETAGQTGWKSWSYLVKAGPHLGVPIIQERVTVGASTAEAGADDATVLGESQLEEHGRSVVYRYRTGSAMGKWRPLVSRSLLAADGWLAADTKDATGATYLRDLFKERLARSAARHMNRLNAELTEIVAQDQSRTRFLDEAAGLLPGPKRPNPEAKPDWILVDERSKPLATSRMSEREKNAIALALLTARAAETAALDNMYIVDARRLDENEGRAAQLAAVGGLTAHGQVLVDSGDESQGWSGEKITVVDMGKVRTAARRK